MLGLIGLANGPCSVLAKHPVVGITKQVAIDYAKDRIHCNSLCPDFVKSAMVDNLIPTDEHERGLGERGGYDSDRGEICCKWFAKRVVPVGDVRKSRRCR